VLCVCCVCVLCAWPIFPFGIWKSSTERRQKKKKRKPIRSDALLISYRFSFGKTSQIKANHLTKNHRLKCEESKPHHFPANQFKSKRKIRVSGESMNSRFPPPGDKTEQRLHNNILFLINNYYMCKIGIDWLWALDIDRELRNERWITRGDVVTRPATNQKRPLSSR